MNINFYFATGNRDLVKNMNFLLIEKPLYGYEVHIAKIMDDGSVLFEAHNGIKSFEDYKRILSRSDVIIYDDAYNQYSWDKFSSLISSSHKYRDIILVDGVYKDEVGFVFAMYDFD